MHSGLMRPGCRVLDIACGTGRHALAAAELGAQVVGIDGDPARLEQASGEAKKQQLSVDWQHIDLEHGALPPGPFDVVMAFYYLDRDRMGDFQSLVKPGGHLMVETYLEAQRQLGEGPNSDAHLLKTGELIQLVRPFELILAREVLEIFDERPRFVASALARRSEV